MLATNEKRVKSRAARVCLLLNYCVEKQNATAIAASAIDFVVAVVDIVDVVVVVVVDDDGAAGADVLVD